MKVETTKFSSILHANILLDSVQTPKMGHQKIDKIRRSFLWKGSHEANGGHCLVQWKKAMRPKNFGGLGILDLDLFSRGTAVEMAMVSVDNAR